MTLTDWAANAAELRRHRGAIGASALSVVDAAAAVGARVADRFSWGKSVYREPWDLLIVLDTCRADALAALADEYSFLPATIPTRRSVGAKTEQWFRRTFNEGEDEDLAETALVTFNPHSDRLAKSRFAAVDEVWRKHWDGEQGVAAQVLADHAIAAGRTTDADRLIAHFKEPHAPYPSLGASKARALDDSADGWTGVFGQLAKGRLDRQTAWNAYLETLRSGLDEVGLLLENVDADRAIITADHGECFGEWGLYGHHRALPVPELVRVPWVETTATDEETRTPAINSGSPGRDVDEKLRALGYL